MGKEEKKFILYERSRMHAIYGLGEGGKRRLGRRDRAIWTHSFSVLLVREKKKERFVGVREKDRIAVDIDNASFHTIRRLITWVYLELCMPK
jgi:hypothetical protein